MSDRHPGGFGGRVRPIARAAGRILGDPTVVAVLWLALAVRLVIPRVGGIFKLLAGGR